MQSQRFVERCELRWAQPADPRPDPLDGDRTDLFRLRRDGALRVGAPAAEVGRVALAAGQVLVELREDGGLEDAFFRLTADPETLDPHPALTADR